MRPSQPSPGPWSIEFPDFDEAHEIYHESPHDVPDDVPGAQISSPKWKSLAIVHVVCNGDKDAEGVANAHLIAAAPDLLEACKRASVAYGANRLSAEAKREIQECLQAAIAKTEGRS